MTQPIEPDLVYPPAGRTSVIGGRTVIDLRGTNFGGETEDQVIGAGAGSPSLTLNKSAGGDADLFLQAASVNRTRIRLDASENLLISRLNGSGVVQDSISYNNGTGLVVLPAGLTVTAGAVALGSTLAVTGATTMAAASATALTASTSLTVTGATVVGLEESLTFTIADLAAAGTYYIVSPWSGTIVKAHAILNGALTTGNAVLTGNIAGAAITNGVITLVQAASAAGDIFTATPTAANTVVAGTSKINFVRSGTNDAAVSCTITLLIRRSA